MARPSPFAGAVRRLALQAALAALLFVAAVNGSVRWVSGTGPFLLDPRALGPKLHALGMYAKHRPVCALLGDAPLAPTIRAAALRHDVDPALLAAIVEVESGNVAHRISWRGACGPAQLTASTARRLGVSDPFDPKESLDGSARLVRELSLQFHSRALVVAAYNAGPAAVHAGVPRNGETELYVPRVLAAWKRLKKQEPQRAHVHGARVVAKGPGRRPVRAPSNRQGAKG